MWLLLLIFGAMLMIFKDAGPLEKVLIICILIAEGIYFLRQ